MNFKALLDKYKKGIATEDEQNLIEQEIDKFEAMEEYLSEGLEMDFRNDESLEDTHLSETANLKKSVNRRLRKVVITSVVSVMVILFSIFYIVSPIIDSMYYNPSRKSVGEYQSDLFFDLRVLTELTLPGYDLSGPVISESLGFGRHSIHFSRKDLLTKDTQNISAQIKRNNRIGSYEYFFGDQYLNSAFDSIKRPKFYDSISQSMEEDPFKVQMEKVMNHVEQLNPVSYVSAYVTFNNDLSMDEFWELSRSYENIDFKWVGIRNFPDSEEYSRHITGFKPSFDGIQSPDIADPERYPLLQLVDAMTKDNPSLVRDGLGKAYEIHYKSLLRFVNDRPDAIIALTQGSFNKAYYQDALEYVEENGVNAFGVLIHAEAQDLIDFVNTEDIKTLELERVLASKPYVNYFGF
ncbi:anti sigma factor C-terminal domain-containing protein [Serpentinicella sp. ANB-PHB4]|uniref:anti sigma factor C-terminal domain-containing protein n=1 Tax=Serpentinicella sp. ANB-PHB4 TaxID=3074076 RepID=UPI002864EC61|nr:anti sigma factor C-terminal domain-containing protein [Serpentinicella sp. ANB-PHB4]MDR5659974.1 anti sigma factor C-terminal domain-containing protein [Serpentinicella sp. ANB-PHB4]